MRQLTCGLALLMLGVTKGVFAQTTTPSPVLRELLSQETLLPAPPVLPTSATEPIAISIQQPPSPRVDPSTPTVLLREWISQDALTPAPLSLTVATEPIALPTIEVVRPTPELPPVTAAAPATPSPSPTPKPKVLPPPDVRLEVKPTLVVPTNPEQITIERTQPITLAEALELVEINSRELKEAKLQLERSRAVLLEAKAVLNPTVGAQLEYTFQDSPIARSLSSPTPYSQPFNGNVGINYNIFTSGRVEADIRAAENTVRLREAEVSRVRQNVRLSVISAYYRLQNADEQVRIRKKSVENNLRSLQDTQALERAGVGTKFDVLQAEVQLAEAQQALQQALGEQYNSRRNLARLLEFPPTVDLSAADPIVQVKDWELNLEDTIITALRNRIELDSTRLQKLIAEERARSVQAQLGPQISVFANYGFADNFSQPGGIGLGYSLGARLNLSLFDGGVAQARLNQTQADQALADNLFQQQINQIRFEVEQAFSNLQSNRQQIATAEKAVQSAAEALRLARLRLSAGVGTQLEVIRTEEDLVRAEVNKLRAIINFNQAIADLQRAINGL
ncbi:MAG: TolC family protein [Pseudanabaenaceae cyanobacterium SKYGB_i_bin29]|nr:TolC family protein [Pseudanabaenaceae cyanobacterium SKYG29]MDW8420312.1 TolC family protein [Pseudanabaenaceae cyanobacterium SKYGB_i_bin29]